SRLPAAAADFALARDTHARAVADARRNADVHGARVAVVLDRQPPHRAVIRVLEAELDLLFDVAAVARSAAACAARAPARVVAGRGAAEEGVEEVRERIGIAEHLAHLVLGHRAKSAGAARRGAAAAEVHVPRAAAERTARTAGCGTRAGLLVHPP